ncbi:MAG: hypothetical protein MK085_07720 [Phycisphaerales bacterium]|nr:hypothetical protein [Phycisphaerales bacterium]
MPDSLDGVHVVLVGHCGPDTWMIRSAVERALPGVTVDMVTEQDQLDAHLQPGRVLLLNRQLDGVFDAELGQELIDPAVAAGAVPLLVSNFAEAQEAALAAGAHEGFGKSAINDEATAEVLRSAAMQASPSN